MPNTPLTLQISMEDWHKAQQAAQSFWAHRKGGVWGGGLINTPLDPHRTERVGLLGEILFGKLIGVPADLSYREGGADADFLFPWGLRIEVKTALTPDFGALVRKTRIGLLSHVYVFCVVHPGERSATFYGYATVDQIRALTPVQSIKGNHQNYQIPYSDLQPIHKLQQSLERKLATYSLGSPKEVVPSGEMRWGNDPTEQGGCAPP